MLTPAEELGLSGLALASRVRKALYQIPEPELGDLIRRIEEEARCRRLNYLRDDKPETVRVLPCPLTVLPDQLSNAQHRQPQAPKHRDGQLAAESGLGARHGRLSQNGPSIRFTNRIKGQGNRRIGRSGLSPARAVCRRTSPAPPTNTV